MSSCVVCEGSSGRRLAVDLVDLGALALDQLETTRPSCHARSPTVQVCCTESFEWAASSAREKLIGPDDSEGVAQSTRTHVRT